MFYELAILGKLTRKEIGVILKHQRNTLMYTYYKASKLSGLTHPQIESIEEGSANYTIDALQRYLKILHPNYEPPE